ncbi:MAG: DNA methyltransferase [Acidiferrobacterales bacterium]
MTATQDIRIIQGDCLEELEKLERNSVDLIFADPPYNQGIDYGDGTKADRLSTRDYEQWTTFWLAVCTNRLKRTGSLWVLCPDEWAAFFDRTLFACGLNCRNWIIWYETFGNNCKRKFNRTKRHLLYFVKNPEHFTFNRSAITRPSDRQAKYNDHRANPNGKNLDDVWTDIPRLAGTHKERIPGFPTQLPLALLRRIVAVSSNPGDLVLDPFSGSATTGVAAMELGRRYIGIEKQPKFVKMSRVRLRNLQEIPDVLQRYVGHQTRISRLSRTPQDF